MAAAASRSAPAAASASAAALIASASEWDLGTAADGPDGRAAGADADGDADGDLWMHESQAQLDADADDPSDSSDPAGPAPLKVLGPRGLYLAPSRPWLLRLRHLFPQREARAWFAAAAVVALGLVAAWMATTISGKWIENVRGTGHGDGVGREEQRPVGVMAGSRLDSLCLLESAHSHKSYHSVLAWLLLCLLPTGRLVLLAFRCSRRFATRRRL